MTHDEIKERFGINAGMECTIFYRGISITMTGAIPCEHWTHGTILEIDDDFIKIFVPAKDMADMHFDEKIKFIEVGKVTNVQRKPTKKEMDEIKSIELIRGR